MNSSSNFSRSEFIAKLEAGLQKSYEKLVARKAKEGGTLIYFIDGKVTEVPATELLAQLNKSAGTNPTALP